MVYLIGISTIFVLFILGNYRFWKLQKERDEYMRRLLQAHQDSEAYFNG